MSISAHPSMQAINWHGSAEPDCYYGWTISYSGEYEDIHPFSSAEARSAYLAACADAATKLGFPNPEYHPDIQLIAAIIASGTSDGNAALEDDDPALISAIEEVWRNL